MRTAVDHGLHGAPWRDATAGSHVARAAKVLAWGVSDAGHLCPISMTYAVVPALRTTPELAAQYEPLLTNRDYDRELRAPLTKRGLIAGMSMTEKQGGSDVRANTTTAQPNADGSYRLVGHKWFTSAPMSDLFLTLAQAPGGLSCFLVPRVLPDGTRNAFFLQRLKDKLGNKSNASSEVEYDDAVGWLVGEEGRGVRTIIEMVNMTRLDCALMAAGGMRIGTAHAVHHATHRSVFGKRLIDQPAMVNVLADLAVDSEAATTVVMRLAGAVDRAARGDSAEAAFRRVGLAVTKYWLCKRWSTHAAESLECLGGNGYVEDSGMPRLYREAPLVSIWEGSGNVAALDTLRAMVREPAAIESFFGELELATGSDARYDDALAMLQKEFTDTDQLEYRARHVVERMAMLLQGGAVAAPRQPRGGRRIRRVAACARLGRRLRDAADRPRHRDHPRPRSDQPIAAAPGPVSSPTRALRPVSSSNSAAISPRTTAPSPRTQSMSVASKRMPRSLRRARYGKPIVHTRSARRGRCLDRHRPADPERHGDVLPVHQRVDERIEIGRARHVPARSGQPADLGGEGLRRLAVAARAVAHHPVEAAAGTDEADGDRARSDVRERQMCRDVTHRPAGAQRRGQPLVGRQRVEEVGKADALGIDRRPHLIAVHARPSYPDATRSAEVGHRHRDRLVAASSTNRAGYVPIRSPGTPHRSRTRSS